ncbi:MAG: ornithine carbamoyltransferase [Planctomycetales bacterium]|nr:ornithine carbamoyltransferase [Planctomycetales bacterium]
MKHLLTLFDVNRDDVEQIFSIATRLKSAMATGKREPVLAQRVAGLLFEKQSLRTRVSFEAGMAQLGGSSIYLGQDVGWGKREPIADFGKVLSQYIDILVFRGKCHEQLVELASHCTCPVINGLTDFSHPCQALADLLTVQELCGGLAGKKIAFIGDGNNVSRSLAIACAMFDVHFSIASPAQYQLQSDFVERVRKTYPDARLELTESPVEAVTGASAVYTDVWASMGQESEANERRAAFRDYQVDAKLMKAGENPYFLHCLPAQRGEEVTADVIDGNRSAIVRQAGNRMHVQKGVLVWLLTH